MGFKFNPLTSELDLVGASSSGGASDSFTTIQTDTGTSPVASSSTDTLTLTSSDGSVDIEGDDATDTVDFKNAGAISPGGTYSVPLTVDTDGELVAQVKRREAWFVQGLAGAVTGVTIAAPPDPTVIWELYLYGVNDSSTVQLITSANVLLNGTLVLRNGTIACLQWQPGRDQYVEVSRNDI